MRLSREVGPVKITLGISAHDHTYSPENLSRRRAIHMQFYRKYICKEQRAITRDSFKLIALDALAILIPDTRIDKVSDRCPCNHERRQIQQVLHKNEQISGCKNVYRSQVGYCWVRVLSIDAPIPTTFESLSSNQHCKFETGKIVLRTFRRKAEPGGQKQVTFPWIS